MTREDIIKLAGHRQVSEWVIKLVADAVAAEREACAVTAEEYFCGCGRKSCQKEDVRAHEIAQAIRARGEAC
jgi:hypothetical protein